MAQDNPILLNEPLDRTNNESIMTKCMTNILQKNQCELRIRKNNSILLKPHCKQNQGREGFLTTECCAKNSHAKKKCTILLSNIGGKSHISYPRD